MEHDEINIAEILDTLYLQRFLIASIAAVFVVLGIIYTVVATPIYQADMLIQIENTESPAKAALGDLSPLFQGKSAAAAEIEILRSRSVVSKAVDTLHLDIEAHPKYFPLIGKWLAKGSARLSKPGLFGMGGYAWGAENITVSRFDVPSALQGASMDLEAEGDGRYRLRGPGVDVRGKVGELLQVDIAGGTIQLQVEKLNANPGTRFVLERHSRLKVVEKLQGRLNIVEKVRGSGMLSVKLDGPDRERITNILNEVGTQYVLQNIERKSAEAERTLQFLDKFLPNLKSNLSKAESRYISASNTHGTVDIGEEVKLTLKRLAAARDKASELKVKRDALLNRLTPAHPAVRAINAQIAAVQGEIARINAKIGKMPGLEREVFGLSRDVKIDSELYTNLLTTAQQLRLFKAGKIGNVRIVDSAIEPEVPVKPRRLLALVVFSVMGILMGGGVAFLRTFLIGGIENAHEIEEHTGLQVLASVPYSSKQKGLDEQIRAKANGMFVLEQMDTHDPAIESMRSFGTALQFGMQDARNNLVMVTGATPGLGKSFVSANFASVMASTGKRVLLIDLDLRKGYLNQHFGTSRDPGIVEFLAGNLSAEQVVRRDVLPNLDFIPTGILPANPNPLFFRPQIAQLLERESAEYDLVLVDMPPSLAVTEAMVLAPHFGTIIVVAREGVTTLGEIQESAKRLAQAGGTITGVVFNGIRRRPAIYGYGNGRYRYSGDVYGPRSDT